MTMVLLKMPEDLRAAAAAQAQRMGVSLSQYLLSIVAAQLGAQAEADRYFAARAARCVPGRWRETLSRAGAGHPPEPGDEIPPDLAERLAARRVPPQD